LFLQEAQKVEIMMGICWKKKKKSYEWVVDTFPMKGKPKVEVTS
jgi:hypothetical protein